MLNKWEIRAKLGNTKIPHIYAWIYCEGYVRSEIPEKECVVGGGGGKAKQ